MTLRNTIHEVLTTIYGPDWPTDLRFERLADEQTVRNIERVQTRIQAKGYNITTPRIVAGLSFDFWASMFKAKYERPVWQTRLHSAFPQMPPGWRRKEFVGLVMRVKDFRNRVAHYEPILRENHSAMHTEILQLIRCRCADTADWVAHHSRVHAVLRERP